MYYSFMEAGYTQYICESLILVISFTGKLISQNTNRGSKSKISKINQACPVLVSIDHGLTSCS